MELVHAKRYSELDPRRELEQTVTRDLKLALAKRDVIVIHHGTAAGPAPSTAPADITLEWKSKGKRKQLLVEVAQRVNESEFTSIVAHLDVAIDKNPAVETHVLYAGRSTSARMVRFIRNENRRREAANIAGRIIFIRLDDLEEVLQHWRTHPKNLYPADSLMAAVGNWEQFGDDLQAFKIIQEKVFPQWSDKAEEIKRDIEKEAASRQERLRRDIINLENKLRERGITGNSAHKVLIYLFFLALYEDKRGPASRFTREGFAAYKAQLPAATRKPGTEFYNYTAHHLMTQDIAHDPEIASSGMLSQYEKIDLTDDFIVSTVLPIFESYALASGTLDVIGAVFEALARRAEKDNRIGQFFTPETAVEATVKLAHLRPTDTVVDPAAGTGRFLIHAMGDMLSKAHTVTGINTDELEESIKKEQLLGVDIDAWVATIGKMNMYLHGDGKSNVRQGNGLTLSIKETFAPERTGTLAAAADAVLTNPPLGEVDFREVGLELARRGDLGPIDHDSVNYEKLVKEAGAAWSNRYLGVVPHVCNEYVARERYKEQVESWRKKEYEADASGDEKKIARAKKHLALAEGKLAEVERRIGAGQLTYTPSGRTTKGGALFLSVIKDYLKDMRDPNAPEEWRGGVVGIVMDEAVLNTQDYEQARAFITRNFFIKAVISLPRDAFAYVARTTAKTSILILNKKPDPDVVQREPVFYARAETIGFSSTGKPVPNDLVQIVEDFDVWSTTARAAYQRKSNFFNQSKYEESAKPLDGYDKRFWAYPLNASKSGERLDFAYRRMVDEISRMKSTIALGDVVTPVVRTPKESSTYIFATVSRKDGRVRLKGEEDTSYKASDLRLIEEGDILMSGIDVVYGSVGVVGPDSDGMVVSKEYYTLRVKDEMAENATPEFIAALLRSPRMKVIIEGTITGTSNRTRIADIASFLNLPIPALPKLKEQEKYADGVRRAYLLQDEALKKLEAVQSDIALSLWKE